MTKWNEEGAPNLNLGSHDIHSSKLISKSEEHFFSEELSDGGERNQMIKKQKKK